MNKCDYCIHDCDISAKRECVVRDYLHFEIEPEKSPVRARLISLLSGCSLDTELQVEHVADMLIRHGVTMR